MSEWPQAIAIVTRHMRENPEMRYSFHGRQKQTGGYCAALAVRTPQGVVTGLIEFANATDAALTVIAVVDAAVQGRDQIAGLREMRRSAEAASCEEPQSNTARADKQSQVEFPQNNALAHSGRAYREKAAK